MSKNTSETTNNIPARPSTIPQEAEWLEDLEHWVLCDVDEYGERQGEAKFWQEDGALRAVFNFTDDILNGPWKRYHPNGEIAEEKTFEDGIEIGVSKVHRSTGPTDEADLPPFISEKAWTLATYHDESGEVIGYASLTKNGHIVDQHGEAKTIIKEYIPAAKTDEPPKGVPADARWLEDEQEWEIGQYDGQNKKQGEFKWWRADGSLACVSLFVDDQLHGKFKRYHPNGKVAQEGEFKMDKPIGRQYWYRSDEPSPEAREFQQLPDVVSTVIMDHDPKAKKPFEYLDWEGNSLG